VSLHKAAGKVASPPARHWSCIPFWCPWDGQSPAELCCAGAPTDTCGSGCVGHLWTPFFSPFTKQLCAQGGFRRAISYAFLFSTKRDEETRQGGRSATDIRQRSSIGKHEKQCSEVSSAFRSP